MKAHTRILLIGLPSLLALQANANDTSTSCPSAATPLNTTNVVPCWVDFVEDPSVFVGLNGINRNEKDIVAADLDNDGDIDIVSAEKDVIYAGEGKPHTILINESGLLVNFSSSAFGTANGSRDVAVLHANDDPYLDLLVANTDTTVNGVVMSQPVGLWINQTTVDGQFGGFVEASNWLNLPTICGAPTGADCGANLSACALATGDLNGDGWDDAWITTYQPLNLPGASITGDRIYLNDGNSGSAPATFTDVTWDALGNLGLSSNGSTSAGLGDYDGIGGLDLMRGGIGAYRVLFNTGNNAAGIPTFSQMSGPGIPLGGSPYMGTGVDLNGDGILDHYSSEDFCDHVVINPGGLAARNSNNWTACRLNKDEHNKVIRVNGGNVWSGDLDRDGFLDLGIGDIDTSVPDTFGNTMSRPCLLRNKSTTTGTFDGLGDPNGLDELSYNISDNSVWDGAFLDLDGDGLLDMLYATEAGFRFFRQKPVSSNYGTTTPNSVGSGATISSQGEPSLSDNNFTLTASGVPRGTSGQFFYGMSTTSVPAFNGTLLVGGTIKRLPLITASSGGEFSYDVDFSGSEFTGVNPCDTLYFQLLYRDAGVAPSGINFSDGLEATVWD